MQEIKRVGVWKSSLYGMIMGAIIGLFLGIMLGFLGNIVSDIIASSIGISPSNLSGLSYSFWIIGIIIGAIMGFIYKLIKTILFNVIQKIIGGIPIDLVDVEEKDEKPNYSSPKLPITSQK